MSWTLHPVPHTGHGIRDLDLTETVTVTRPGSAVTLSTNYGPFGRSKVVKTSFASDCGILRHRRIEIDQILISTRFFREPNIYIVRTENIYSTLTEQYETKGGLIISDKSSNRLFNRHASAVRHAAVCLVLIAVAAFLLFTPLQSEDSFGEESDIYEITWAFNPSEPVGVDDLAEAFDFINNSGESDFIITVRTDHTVSVQFVLNKDKNVILTSFGSNTVKLTAEEGVRHGTVVLGTLTLKNITLNGNMPTGGICGGIVVGANGTLIMESGAEIENCFADNGGAVFSQGTFTMNGGTIRNSTASSGGGVYNAGTFTMNGGAIFDNTATYGGGVHNRSNATFILNNGEISRNTADAGGGVYNRESIFTMTGGEIFDNTALDEGYKGLGGGGVYNYYGISNESIFTMEGGKIWNNTAPAGGGVFNTHNATFILNNGEISGNKATGKIASGMNKAIQGNGSGVYNNGSATFTMTGGNISGNTSTGYGGVYNSGLIDGYPADAIFTMTGGKISKNTTSLGGKGVYNAGEFTMNGGEISENKGNGNGGGVYNAKTFTMSGGTISGNTGSSGAGVYTSNIFTMTGGTISGNTGSSGAGVYTNSVFTMTGGQVSENISSGGGGGIMSSGTFTLTGGKISGNKAAEGGGIVGYGTFDMSGSAVITKNTGATLGGGVSILGTAAHFTMTGGEISENTALVGGGVFIEGTSIEKPAVFEMNGDALICNNKVTSGKNTYGGGVANFGGGAFYMKGGKITGNEAKGTEMGYGGGVMSTLGIFEMSGGTISDNTASRGGGIYNTSSSTLVVYNSNIIDNTAEGPEASIGSGGGIYTGSYSELKVGEGVVFSGNKAPTLRIYDISDDDQKVYSDNIKNVKLDKMFGVIKKAPAYNNFDINYAGDVYVVTIVIEPNGSGTVTLTDSVEGTVYAMTEDGHVFVLIEADPVTLLASPKGENEFIEFVINIVHYLTIYNNSS